MCLSKYTAVTHDKRLETMDKIIDLIQDDFPIEDSWVEFILEILEETIFYIENLEET